MTTTDIGTAEGAPRPGNDAAPRGSSRARPEGFDSTTKSYQTNFRRVGAAALAAADAVLSRWLPDGRRQGAEYVARNPTRDDGRAGSFTINGNSGAWADFATGDRGGDLVSLVAYLDGVRQPEAARRLAEFLGIDPISAVPAVPRSRGSKTTSKNSNLHAVETGTAPGTAAGPAVPAAGPAPAWTPAPADAPAPPDRHRQHGEPSARWCYRDATGAVLGYVYRFDAVDGGKQVLPVVWTADGWRWRGLPVPRPLYGLDRLALRPGAPVLVCEGEKAADAAQALFHDYITTTSPNGAQSAGKADWRPLAGRRVLIWPDADTAGTAYAEAAAKLATAAGAASVQLLDLRELRRTAGTDADGRPILEPWPAGRELPAGWDAADALAEGWTAAHVTELVRQLDILECCPFVPTLADRAEALAEAAASAVGTADAPAAFVPHFELLEDWSEDAQGRRRPPGVYWHGCDRQGEPLPPAWLCSPLRVEAMTRDADGGAWGRLLVWRDRDGRRHEWAMPAALLAGDGVDLRRELLAGGLAITSHRQDRQRIEDYLTQARPAAFARCVERTGWYGDVFVLPGRTFGEGAERVLFQSETIAGSTHAEAGTLAGWRDQVAALCVGNSRLLLAASCGFAALLLGRLGDESGGIHLRGASSTGKSTALAVAASLFGPPARYVQRWRATSNGLEAMAAAHCDGLLILDELAQVDPREAGEAAYLLANGQGKARAARTGGARARASWRLLFLSAGEIGLSAHMQAAGKRTHAGQEIRLADLDADAGKGFGLFENLHGRADGAALARELAEATSRHHGTAGPAFLSALVAELDQVAAVEAVRRAWLARHLPAGASGQAHRVAGRFALIGAAGEIATGYGLTGWPRGAALESAATCFRAWADGRGGAGNREPAAMLEAVRRFLLAHGEARFADLDGSDDRRTRLNRAGFRRQEPGAGWRYFIPAEGWPEVCSGFDPKAVAALLAARGCLDTEDGRTTRRERLPELGRVRCYVVTPALWGDDDAA